MVLQAQSPGTHNQMLGQRIRHPSSTNYDEDFRSPTAKRLKRHESTDSSLSRNVSEEEEEELAVSPVKRALLREIPDSEAESDEDEFPATSGQKTDLESALPPIKTNKDAIAEYEATRAAEEADASGMHARLGQRKWVQGKSSIYVDAFNLTLETVLEDEAHLFNEVEMTVFEHWRGLSYEAQYLWVYSLLQNIWGSSSF